MGGLRVSCDSHKPIFILSVTRTENWLRLVLNLHTVEVLVRLHVAVLQVCGQNIQNKQNLSKQGIVCAHGGYFWLRVFPNVTVFVSVQHFVCVHYLALMCGTSNLAFLAKLVATGVWRQQPSLAAAARSVASSAADRWHQVRRSLREGS